MTTAKKPFVDEGIFEGLVIYYDEHGTKWLRENKSYYYAFYREKETCCVCEGRLMQSRKIFGIRDIHEQFIKNSMNQGLEEWEEYNC